ncbi:hypothetical protein KA005_31705 [bacterium]|nr:hypothetical protein [bacterium]
MKLKQGYESEKSYDELAMIAVAQNDFIDSPQKLSKEWKKATILIMRICKGGERTYGIENWNDEEWLYGKYKEIYSERFSDIG